MSLTLRALPKVTPASGGELELDLRFPGSWSSVFSVSDSVLTFCDQEYFHEHLLRTIQKVALMVDH